MSSEQEKRENIEFMSDFLLRIARIAGNASLTKGGGRYLITCENECGEYISYGVMDHKIQGALHKNVTNIVTGLLSTKRIEDPGKLSIISSLGIIKEHKENLIYKFSTDYYPWEAIDGLPFELKRKVGMSHSEVSIDRSEEKKELAKKLSLGIWHKCHSERNDIKPEIIEDNKKYEPLRRLIAKVMEVSEDVSVRDICGIYYISIPTKEGDYITFSTSDELLEKGENYIFEIRRHQKELNMPNTLDPIDAIEEMVTFDNESTELMNDATIGEAEYNLLMLLGIGEHSASEISGDLQEIGRQGLTEGALAEVVDEKGTKDNNKGEK